MRVGFVGLGTMGGAMAANAARAGFEVSAWNRTPGRAAELEDLGVSLAASPAAVAAASEIVITIVSDTPDVEAVLFGPDGVAEGAAAGSLVVDMSTISPSATRDFAARLAEQRRRDARRARLGRQRGREEGHAVDLRRRRRRGPRARPARPRRASARRSPTSARSAPGQAVKAVNQVILAGHVPRRRRGHRPRAEVRPRRRAGRRRAVRRRGAVVGPHEPQRPDARQRLPARVQGRAPPQGPRHRAVDGPRARRVAAGQRAVRGDRGRAHRPGPRRRRHVRGRPLDPRALGPGVS